MTDYYACNGHFLIGTNIGKNNRRYHFSDLYEDENNELCVPIQCAFNGNIIYKYVKNSNNGYKTTERYLVPCLDEHNRLGYVKVLMDQDLHEGSTLNKHMELNPSDKFHIINSNPKGEEFMNSISYESNRIARKLHDSNIKVNKNECQNNIKNRISKNQNDITNINFNVNNSLRGKIHLISESQLNYVSFKSNPSKNILLKSKYLSNPSFKAKNDYENYKSTKTNSVNIIKGEINNIKHILDGKTIEKYKQVIKYPPSKDLCIILKKGKDDLGKKQLTPQQPPKPVLEKKEKLPVEEPKKKLSRKDKLKQLAKKKAEKELEKAKKKAKKKAIEYGKETRKLALETGKAGIVAAVKEIVKQGVDGKAGEILAAGVGDATKNLLDKTADKASEKLEAKVIETIGKPYNVGMLPEYYLAKNPKNNNYLLYLLHRKSPHYKLIPLDTPKRKRSKRFHPHGPNLKPLTMKNVIIIRDDLSNVNDSKEVTIISTNGKISKSAKKPKIDDLTFTLDEDDMVFKGKYNNNNNIKKEPEIKLKDGVSSDGLTFALNEEVPEDTYDSTNKKNSTTKGYGNKIRLPSNNIVVLPLQETQKDNEINPIDFDNDGKIDAYDSFDSTPEIDTFVLDNTNNVNEIPLKDENGDIYAYDNPYTPGVVDTFIYNEQDPSMICQSANNQNHEKEDTPEGIYEIPLDPEPEYYYYWVKGYPQTEGTLVLGDTPPLVTDINTSNSNSDDKIYISSQLHPHMINSINWLLNYATN